MDTIVLVMYTTCNSIKIKKINRFVYRNAFDNITHSSIFTYVMQEVCLLPGVIGQRNLFPKRSQVSEKIETGGEAI